MTTLAAFFFGLILGGPLGYGMACLMFVIVNDDYDKPEKPENDEED